MNDNERERLAYERILLQSLVAHMSWTEPRFVNHLKDRFVAPMAQAIRDHDRTTADDRGNDFIRSILRIIERPSPDIQDEAQVEAADTGGDGGTLLPKSTSFTKKLSADRVDIIETDEAWEVRVDDIFWGDYFDKESAHVAADLVRQSL
ncbi:hypothetical protein F1188_18065 [Roseospira marina]|uniref:Uncharacterized protein n=1 Tax=Roseospira marina TaxID=140057 RepID=A0A5M6I874_9PROT|nr:hypothetical protein [Roseospira marina]KAA5604005.1 hypothetical protein F1188_18065 [Roseospira marina]MBB4315893.1 hypothetical protein [Roseospira marina]MBB5089061.1 hypothetical protein [Roseospira marina]